jgi:hypothetical protein
MKKKANFKPINYKSSKETGYFAVEIEGQKLPAPSKRITLKQPGIKVLSAKIIYKHKKGDSEYEVIRINHLKSFGEVRLHSNSMLYPGNYNVKIKYTGVLDESNLGENKD